MCGAVSRCTICWPAEKRIVCIRAAWTCRQRSAYCSPRSTGHTARRAALGAICTTRSSMRFTPARFVAVQNNGLYASVRHGPVATAVHTARRAALGILFAEQHWVQSAQRDPRCGLPQHDLLLCKTMDYMHPCGTASMQAGNTHIYIYIYINI